MNSRGYTVLLNASHEALMRRHTIPSAKNKRPIIANKTNDELSQFNNEAMEKRAVFYNQAVIHFDSDYLESVEQVATSTASLYEKLIELSNNEKE